MYLTASHHTSVSCTPLVKFYTTRILDLQNLSITYTRRKSDCVFWLALSSVQCYHTMWQIRRARAATSYVNYPCFVYDLTAVEDVVEIVSYPIFVLFMVVARLKCEEDLGHLFWRGVTSEICIMGHESIPDTHYSSAAALDELCHSFPYSECHQVTYTRS